jgi:hypothetical protein
MLTGEPIKGIASECGLLEGGHDDGRFQHLFKKTFGLTPGEIRKLAFDVLGDDAPPGDLGTNSPQN